MARIRYIKPDFITDLDIASLSLPARYLYQNLWCHMDRDGVCEADSRLVKHQIFPYDDEFTSKRVSELLSELVSGGFLFPVEHNDKRYFFCPTLEKHQNFHKDEKPKFNIPISKLQAAPCQHGANTVLAPYEHPISTTGTGIETGIETGTVNALACATATPNVREIPNEEAGCIFGADPLVVEFLSDVPVRVQEIWLKRWGPDRVWMEAQIKDCAVKWETAGSKVPGKKKVLYVFDWFQNSLKTKAKAEAEHVVPTPPKYETGYLATRVEVPEPDEDAKGRIKRMLASISGRTGGDDERS